MIGHRLMASSLAYTGDLVKGIAHYDKALEPVKLLRLGEATTAR
jgi:hypothetical protein